MTENAAESNEPKIIDDPLETDPASFAKALVRVTDQLPTVLPAIILNELVPFPGPIVPIILDQDERRNAILHAKSDIGYVVLINRHTSPSPPAAAPKTNAKSKANASSTAKNKRSAAAKENLPEKKEFSAAKLPRSPVNVSFSEPPDSFKQVITITVEPTEEGQKLVNADTLNATNAAAASPSFKKNLKMNSLAAEDEHLSAEDLPADNEDHQTSGSKPHKLFAKANLSNVGIVARLIKVIRLPDDRLSALVHLLRRVQPVDVLKLSPFPIVRVIYPVEVVSNQREFEAMYRQVRAHLQAFFDAHPHIPEELKIAALGIENPSTFADFVAQHLSRNFNERLDFLTELDLAKRLKRALEVTLRELDLLTVGNRISQEIHEKIEKHQREFLLREQLKAIRIELGEEKDPHALALSELREKLEKAELSEVAKNRAEEELKRLQLLPSESPEYNVVRSYLDWIASLPWSKLTPDQQDLQQAKKILDEDHYGLKEIKERIIEFLAVHQLNPDRIGTLLCFAGPPGVGKTSLGQSIARALGREFYRFSVGGMRDEAEIKGHRRTYIGAMPGRILQGLKQVKTANPVFMLDELDKMGTDWRGDPASALLEVLDPAQNKAFVDHYLDLPFDLSRVMFIATANVKSEIPEALRDRLEIIDLSGYIPEEKLEIAKRYLLKRQRQEHGLKIPQLKLPQTTIQKIIQDYTREAGVRELERLLSKLCRKQATNIVMKQKLKETITPADLKDFLGPSKNYDDLLVTKLKPGLAIGLAWTAVGGDILFIEAAQMPGKGNIKITGHLGDVMNESTGLAVSYVRSESSQFKIDPKYFTDYDLHLHFPAGAVKKDGPSAGITITTAIISLLTQRAIKPRLAMTGEMTLRGEVLPVGGIREKVVAARRAGVKTVIIPKRNQADVEEIPNEIKKHLKFIFVEEYREVLKAVFK